MGLQQGESGGFLSGGKRRVMLEEQKSQTLINNNAQLHGIMRFFIYLKSLKRSKGLHPSAPFASSRF